MKDLYAKSYKIFTKEFKTQIEIHVYGLEGLILLRGPYYPKQFTDSVQLLSKCQWQFL